MEIVGYVVSRSRSGFQDVRTQCEHMKKKGCRKALVQFNELAMFRAIEEPKDKGEILNCIGTVQDHVDRSDEVVVGTTERVVEARFVCRTLEEQREEMPETRRVSKACRGSYGKECRERIGVTRMCDDAGQKRLLAAEERFAPAASAARAEEG